VGDDGTSHGSFLIIQLFSKTSMLPLLAKNAEILITMNGQFRELEMNTVQLGNLTFANAINMIFSCPLNRWT
jgi:hypothetical protein